MAYQVTTKTSYGQRVKNSFGGIGAGILLLIIGTGLLWWNEGRAVKTSKMLGEAEKVAVHVSDVSSVDPSYDGLLIHASAAAVTADSLFDTSFGVGAVALRLKRDVQYYQYVEHSSTQTKDKVGGAQESVTTYTYSKEWSSRPVDSGQFQDPDYRSTNFTLMTPSEQTWQASNVSFGAYRLPANMVSGLPCSKAVELHPDAALLDGINADIRNYLKDTLDTRFVHTGGNVIYLGRNASAPEIGDVRITFTEAACGDVSLLARVEGDSFTSFTASNGKSFYSLTPGVRSMEEMFQSEHSANKMWLWVLRVVGLLLVIGAFRNIFDILVTLLKVLPPLASVANLGVRLVCGVVGTVWTLLVVTIAWIRYRPVLAIVLLAAAVALIVYLCLRSKKAKAASAA